MSVTLDKDCSVKSQIIGKNDQLKHINTNNNHFDFHKKLFIIF
jgi:hypothetical protein